MSTGEIGLSERSQVETIPAPDGSAIFAKAQHLLQCRHIEAAIDAFNAAQDVGFAANLCAGARWHCWMLLGAFERAWQESDFVDQTGAPDINRLWNGQTWSGKRVILRCIHGLGDTIQFVRYARLLARDT